MTRAYFSCCSKSSQSYTLDMAQCSDICWRIQFGVQWVLNFRNDLVQKNPWLKLFSESYGRWNVYFLRGLVLHSHIYLLYEHFSFLTSLWYGLNLCVWVLKKNCLFGAFSQCSIAKTSRKCRGEREKLFFITKKRYFLK